MRVVLSTTTKDKLEDVLMFLKEKWSDKVKAEFIVNLDIKINQVT